MTIEGHAAVTTATTTGTQPSDDPRSIWLSATLSELRAELSALRPVLATRIGALRGGSLKRCERVWFNASAACPVPDNVIDALVNTLSEPHVTLQRGADTHTRDLDELWQTQIERFCTRYTGGQGTLLVGHNATHMLMAVGRTLLCEQAGLTIAHGDVDHKASYALSGLQGWQQRLLVPYSDAGFYDRHTLANLPRSSVLLLNALHHVFGTLQHDALASIAQDVPIFVDLSQAMSTLPPARLTGFLSRAFGAAFNLGKAFSPSSLGVLWLRDADFAQRVIALNPELSGSVSSMSIHALASAGNYLYEAVDEDWYTYVWTLTRYAVARLTELEHVSLIGCSSFQANTQKLAIVSFSVDGMTPAELGMHLDARGMAVRADGRCTYDGEAAREYDCVRISLLPHLTPDDIDALAEEVRACA